MESNRFWQSSNDLLPLRFTTLTTSNEGVLYAGTDGKGVFQFTPLRSWENASQGLPDHLRINRLDWVDTQLYVSTNLGLYVLEDDVWKQTSVSEPCYRVIGWGDRFVLTSKDSFAEAMESGSRLPIVTRKRSICWLLRIFYFLDMRMASLSMIY